MSLFDRKRGKWVHRPLPGNLPWKKKDREPNVTALSLHGSNTIWLPQLTKGEKKGKTASIPASVKGVSFAPRREISHTYSAFSKKKGGEGRRGYHLTWNLLP